MVMQDTKKLKIQSKGSQSSDYTCMATSMEHFENFRLGFAESLGVLTHMFLSKVTRNYHHWQACQYGSSSTKGSNSPDKLKPKVHLGYHTQPVPLGKGSWKGNDRTISNPYCPKKQSQKQWRGCINNKSVLYFTVSGSFTRTECINTFE